MEETRRNKPGKVNLPQITEPVSNKARNPILAAWLQSPCPQPPGHTTSQAKRAPNQDGTCKRGLQIKQTLQGQPSNKRS